MISSVGALNDLTVLDLTDEKGMYVGKLLADMGANVIKVEPPGGDSARAIGPFLHDQSQNSRSLFYWYVLGYICRRPTSVSGAHIPLS